MLGMLIVLGLGLLHLVIAVRQTPHPQTHTWEEDNEWLIQVHTMSWDLRFSQACCWWFKSSGMFHCVSW